ncbi:hypothetical protein ACLOJK_017252 [Asimina triloba]
MNGSIWKKIVNNALERECFFNAREDESLAEAIIRAERISEKNLSRGFASLHLGNGGELRVQPSRRRYDMMEKSIEYRPQHTTEMESEKRMKPSKKKGDEREKGPADFIFSWSAKDIFNKDLFEDKLLAKAAKDRYMISVEPLRNGPHNEGSCVPKAGDMFALSEVIPSSVDDLKRIGASFVMGLVKTYGDDETRPPPFQIKAKVSKHFQDAVIEGRCIFAVFFSNLTTNTRIWNALHMQEATSQGIIREVLLTNSSVERSCKICYAGRFKEEAQNLMDIEKSNPTAINLNESQLTAVVSSMAARRCQHKHSVQLIWGPPGTGKTNTIAVLLLALLASKSRVLACAPTNVAVVQVASRLLKSVKLRPSRDDGLCRLGDMVLMGNEARMNITDDLREIFLGERLRKLGGCLAPATGWRYQLMSAINFLQDVYLENRNEDDDNDSDSDGVMDFGEYVRKRFDAIVTPLELSIRTLYTHLPSAPFSESYLDDHLVRALYSIRSLQRSLARARNVMLEMAFKLDVKVNDQGHDL